jgi:hypothetical protein
MKTLALIPLLLLSASVCATETGDQVDENKPLELKNGSFLFINEDNTMRMVDKDGKPVIMEDGVEMELTNGDLIMMKSKRLWRHDHRKMK